MHWYNCNECGKHIFTRPSSDPLSSQGLGGGVKQKGRYVKSKLQETTPFIEVESLDVPPEHTHMLSAA